MKNTYKIILIILLNTIVSLSNEFEFTPLYNSYYSIEAFNDIVVACGDFGTANFSFDNGESWQQKRIFEKGGIVKIFLNENQFTAFSDCGEIGISNNLGKNWVVTPKINDSVYAVIEYPKGYFLRAKDNLIIFNKEFEIINKFAFSFYLDWSRIVEDKKIYRTSLTYFNGQLIALTDSLPRKNGHIESSQILRFDDNLNLIDTVQFSKIGYLGICTWISADSNYFYFKGINIARTKDFKNWEYYSDSFLNNISKIRIEEDKMVFLSAFKDNVNFNKIFNLYEKNISDSNYTSDTAQRIFYFNKKWGSSSINIQDFIINNGRIFIVGKKNFILIIEQLNNKIIYFSDSYDHSTVSIPYRISDSTFIFIGTQNNGSFYPRIYRTDNKGLSFYPTYIFINDSSGKTENFFKPWDYIYNYFDIKEKKIYFLGSNEFYSLKEQGSFVTDNFGESFKYKKAFIEPNIHPKSVRAPNMQKVGETFVCPINTAGVNGNGFIRTYTLDFDTVFTMILPFTVTQYVHSTGENNYLIHCYNVLDTINEIKFTTDKGQNWTYIKKYTKNDSLLYYKELKFKDKEYLAILYRSKVDTTARIDILDIENKTVTEVFKFKIIFYTPPKWNKYVFVDENISICNDDNYIYVANNDTIFYSKDIIKLEKWEYKILPYKGKIYRTFFRIDDDFYAWYEDEIHEKNVYWIKSPKITPVEEPKSENDNYLYSFPAYPVPSSNGYIRAMIYWDNKDNIDKAKITITNAIGEIIPTENRITIEKQGPNNGTLNWNCSGEPKGAYFIKIQHGDKSNTLKVIVE